MMLVLIFSPAIPRRIGVKLQDERGARFLARSHTATSSGLPVDCLSMTAGSEGAGGGDPSRLLPPPPGGGKPDAAAMSVPPPLGSPRWPASALFRWEEQAGPRDVWDVLPFPQEGPGVFGRLSESVAGSSLFRGHDGLSPALIVLSAGLNVGGALQLLPLKNDEDVGKAVQLWQLCPATAGVIAISVRGEGAAANAAALNGGVAGSRVQLPPPLLLHRGGGPRWPRPAPATLASSLPVDFWTCVLNAITSCRCVAFAVFCKGGEGGSLPPSFPHSSLLPLPPLFPSSFLPPSLLRLLR